MTILDTINYKLFEDIDDKFERALLRAAEDAVNLASQLAPIDTGALKDSGKADIVGVSEVEISFGNGLPDIRAIAQEFGTVNHPPQPYFFPALKAIKMSAYVLEELGIKHNAV